MKFGFKKKNQKNNEEEFNLAEKVKVNKEKNSIANGVITLKDLLAPSSFDRSNEYYIKVGNKCVRNFIMQGYPTNVSIGWLDSLFNYEGDIDTAIYIEPADERTAINELTEKITQFQSQYDIEYKRGNIKNLTKLQNSIDKLIYERTKLEQNYENLFYVEITSNLTCDTVEQLDKETQELDNKLKGKRINFMPSYLRQDDGYKTALPYAKPYIVDMYRNFNSGALTACFPFYNSEIYHENGILCGLNMTNKSPVLIDFYNRKLIKNSNMTVFGESGAGKSFMVSLLTMRSILRGIRSVIIDPDNEYARLTQTLGGVNVDIAPGSSHTINVFDLEAEDILDDNDKPTGRKIVKIQDKLFDLLNLLEVMSGGLTVEQRSIVSSVLKDLYTRMGFSEDADSLVSSEPYFDEETGEFHQSGVRKPMPTFSDFHKDLEEYGLRNNNRDITKLANTLKIYTKGQAFDMFDCQTSEDLINMKEAPIITFNISNLEENVLRPIGMYIVLSLTWERWIKKDLTYKKRVVCDEAWMLLNKNMSGYKYTAKFLEVMARRVRKRNGGLLVASQNFSEFTNCEEGKAVLTNSSVNIFLSQNSTDLDAVQDTFKLSDGEIQFLSTAGRGEALIKLGNESIISQTIAFDYEKQLIGI